MLISADMFAPDSNNGNARKYYRKTMYEHRGFHIYFENKTLVKTVTPAYV